MAGLTGRVDLTSAHERGAGSNMTTARDAGCGGRCQCGVDFHRGGVAVAMAVEVGTVAGRARGTSHFASCATDQQAGRSAMTRSTAKVGMSLSNRRVGSCRRCSMAACAQRYRGHTMDVCMSTEIAAAMAGLTVATTGRHGRGKAIGRLQRPVGVVTGGAGVVDLVVGRIDRNAGGCTDDASCQMA